MTNEEIVKALRCCAANYCNGCQLYVAYPKGGDCIRVMATAAADLIENQQNHIRALLQANDALRPAWIPVTEGLPQAEDEVLVVCNRNGFRFVCPAIYEDGTVLTQDSMWNWYEIGGYGAYSEENDDYFVPEGWWENRQFTPDDVYNSQIDCEVVCWMPLPKAPEVE